MGTIPPTPPTPPNRSDDLTFLRLYDDVKRLERDVQYLQRLVYIPQDAEGSDTLMAQAAHVRQQLEGILARQRWLQGLGGAILVGIVVQIVAHFLKK